MAIARDANHVVSGAGISDDDRTTVLPLTIDPVTGRLLAVLTLTIGGGEVVNTGIERDTNHTPVGAGVSASDGVTILPLSMDSSTFYLNCDAIIG